MKKCHECGKKLGFIGGYRHPTLGKKYHLCASCFDKVYQSIENYRDEDYKTANDKGAGAAVPVTPDDDKKLNNFAVNYKFDKNEMNGKLF